MSGRQPPVIQVVGYKNSGKTTLICELLKRFRERGLLVATAKHHGHEGRMDIAGTDTSLHRDAGACATAIASPGLSAVWEAEELSLSSLVDRLPPCDLVLAEGFKDADYPKWVLLREEADLPLLGQVSNIMGASARFAFEHPTHLILPPYDYDGIAELLIDKLGHLNVEEE